MDLSRDPRLLEAGSAIFDYLRLEDPLPRETGLIIGFGHFDLRIPRLCGELYQKYKAPVLFTGGTGSGTADLGRPEADAFRDELNSLFPGIPPDQVLAENRSSNTTENILFSGILWRETTGKSFPDSAILVATPYRQRRVFQTCEKNLGSRRFFNAPVPSTFSAELQRFRSKGQDLLTLLAGEIERLVVYAEKGCITAEKVPRQILDLCETIRQALNR